MYLVLDRWVALQSGEPRLDRRMPSVSEERDRGGLIRLIVPGAKPLGPGKRAEGLLVYPVDRASRARKLRMEFTFLSAPGEATDNYDIFFTREIRD